MEAAVGAVGVVQLHKVRRAGVESAADIHRVGQLGVGHERLADGGLGCAIRLKDGVDGALQQKLSVSIEQKAHTREQTNLRRVVVHQVVPAHEHSVTAAHVVLAVDVLREEDTERGESCQLGRQRRVTSKVQRTCPGGTRCS